MYLVPSRPLGVQRARRRMGFYVTPAAPGQDRIAASQSAAVEIRRRLPQLSGIYFSGRRGDRAALFSGLGCKECRTGLSWLGQGDSLTPPDISSTGPGGSFNPVGTPDILSTEPTTIPYPTFTIPKPVIRQVSPVVVPLPSFNPNYLPAGTDANQAPSILTAAAATPPLQRPAGPTSASWLDRQTIQGVPNKFLVAGLAGIVLLGAAGAKGRG